MMETEKRRAPNRNAAKPEWFELWFDSPYYHLLYHYRDEAEAEAFIDHLLEQFKPAPGARMLDLACGRGRHSLYLAGKGFEVVGIDLSEKNITFAQRFEKENLSFFTHDMRHPFRTNYFDYIFNFFTSFGYFRSEKDDLNILKNVFLGMRQQGIFILDFFNAHLVLNHLKDKEIKTVSGIHFNIERHIQNHCVFKDINIEDKGRKHHFTERVRLFLYDDFQRLFRQAGLKILQTYGDYQLGPFIPDTSPRLILAAEKI